MNDAKIYVYLKFLLFLTPLSFFQKLVLPNVLSIFCRHSLCFFFFSLSLKGTRESLGIRLKGSVVVLDEAHNIIETVNAVNRCAPTSLVLPSLVINYRRLWSHIMPSSLPLLFSCFSGVTSWCRCYFNCCCCCLSATAVVAVCCVNYHQREGIGGAGGTCSRACRPLP